MSISKVLAIYTPDGSKPIKKRLRGVVQSYFQKDLDDVYDGIRSKFSECFSNSNFVIEINGETILPADTQKFGDSVKGLKELEIVIKKLELQKKNNSKIVVKNTVTKREIEQALIDEKEGEADIDWEKVYNDLIKNINNEFKVSKFLLQNKDEIHVEGADDLKQEWEEINDSGDSTLELFLSYEETKEKKFNVINGTSLLFEFTPKHVNDSNEAVMKDTWKKNWNGLRDRVFKHLQLQNNEKLFLLSRMDERDDMIEYADELSDYFNELLNDDNSEAFQIIVICFIFEYDGHYVSWIPSSPPLSTEIEKYDWRNAFQQMKQYVLKHFQLENEDLQFQNAQDKSNTIDDERDLKYIWGEMLKQDCLGVFRVVVKNSDSSLDEPIEGSNAKAKKKEDLEEAKYENKENDDEKKYEVEKSSIEINKQKIEIKENNKSAAISKLGVSAKCGQQQNKCKDFMNVVVDTLLNIKPDEDRDKIYSTWGSILNKLENNTNGKEVIVVVREFLDLLGFTLTKNAKDYLITGQPNIDTIKLVKQNFDVLEDGVIIEDNENSLLEIEIPKNDNEVKRQKVKEYFDINLMLELVDEAEKAAIQIKDQNVILLLGGTGAGKSTCIHFLAGSVMQEKLVDGKPHIAPVQVKNKALHRVSTSSKAASETRYITAVPIDLKEMGILGAKGNVILCDTPGFEDTNGPEVDVANGIGIIRALQQCKSVKPVVLISYVALGHRMSCVKELARTLVGIIPSIENHISAFSYVFTKLPKEQKTFMHALAKDTYNAMENDPDEGYKAILLDIARKTKKEVIAPDLIHDSPSDLLEELIDLKNFITHPEDVFCPFLSEASKSAVSLQVKKHKENILLAFQRGDYNIAKIKLDELARLNSVLKNATIETEINDCVKKLTREWNQKSDEAKSAFNKRISSPHNLSNDDVLAYKKVYDELGVANGLRNHLPDAASAESLNQNINEQMNQLMAIIEQQINGGDESGNAESVLKIHLDKMAQVQSCFPAFSASYKEAGHRLKKRFANCVDDAKECITKNKFAEFQKNLKTIAKGITIQEHICSLIDIKKEIKNLESELSDYLQRCATEEGLAVLKKSTKEISNSSSSIKNEEKIDSAHILLEKLDKNGIDIVQKTIDTLEAAVNVFEVPWEHVGLDKFTKQLFRSFLIELIGYFEKISQKICNLFEKQKSQAFDEIKGFVLVMDDLRKVKTVEQKTERQYFQTIEKIFGFVRDVHKDVDNILASLSKSDASVDYNRLYECVLCVSHSKWIDERQEGGNTNLMDAIKQKLFSHLYELQQSSLNLELDLDHPNQLAEARKIVTHLGNLRRLETIIPKISTNRKEVSMQLEHSIRATLATIRREFSLETKNVNCQEKIKDYLIQLKTECVSNANSYLKKMHIENAQKLMSQIQEMEEELTKGCHLLKEKCGQRHGKIQIVRERINKLEAMKQKYNQLNKASNSFSSITSFLSPSGSKEAVEYIGKQGFKSIEEVQEEEKKKKKALENLKAETLKLKDAHTQKMDEIKNTLQKNKQIRKEFEDLLQKGLSSLGTTVEALKSHNFLQSDIQRLINNENELNEKIHYYEREIAKIKNSTGHNFDLLNVSRTEKVLRYLKECKATAFSTETTTPDQRSNRDRGDGNSEEKKEDYKTAPPLKQDVANTFDLVEHFLQHYSKFVQSQLNSLDFTESAVSESGDNTKIIEKVEIIFNRLNEVKKLEKSSIFAYFPEDMLEQFEIKLRQTHQKMADEMLKLDRDTNTKPLRIKIVVASALSALDDFAKPNYKFKDLYMKYQDKIYNDTIDTKPVLDAIKEHRYSTVAAEMFRIKQNIDDPKIERVFNDIKNALSRSLNDLARTTLMKVLLLGENDVDLTGVTKLVDHLEWMKDAQQFALTFVDEVVQRDIERMQENTKSAIGKWMEAILDTMDASVSALNFLEAENKIRLVRRIISILGDYCESISLDDDTKKEQQQKKSGNQNTGKIMSCVDKLGKKIETKLKDIVEKYRRIKLEGKQFNPYSSAPPKELYTRLIKVMETTAIYRDTWREIEDDISQKVRNELIEARAKVGNSSSRDSNSSIRLCQSVLNTLPKHMQIMLGEEITHCNDDIKSELDHTTGVVNEVIKSKNIDDINNLLNNCTSNQEKMIKTNVNAMAQEIVVSMNKKWTEGDTTKALIDLKEIVHFKNTFKKKIPEINKYFTTARGTLVNTFEKCQKNIGSNFDVLDRGDIGSATMEWMENALDFIIQCIEVQAELTSSDAQELMPNNFNDRIKELDLKISKYFTSLHQKYKTNVDQLNVPDLHKVLDVMETVASKSSLLQKVKHFKQKKTYCGLPEDSTKIWTYAEVMRDLNACLEKMAQDTMDEGIDNEKTKSNDAERDRFFNKLKVKIEFFKQMSQLERHIGKSEKLEECPKKLELDVQVLAKKVQDNTKWTPLDCNNVNLCYNCFISMQKHGILSSVVKLQIEAVSVVVTNRVEQLEKEAMQDLNTEKIVPHLLSMKKMSMHIFSFKDSIGKQIDKLLSAFKQKHQGGIGVSMLALQLEKDVSGIGAMIVAEHGVFQGYSVSMFNQKIQAHELDYVLQKIETKGDKLDGPKLENRYNEFKEKYCQLLKDNLAKSQSNNASIFAMLANNTKLIFGGVEQKPGQERWDANIRNKIPILMAHIFALWTLQNSHYFHDAKEAEDQDSYLLQPHPAQVISIFRMLGIDESKVGLTKNLVQIGTGEGKSVTLAVTSCVLALLGFDVSCASYSEHLSSRDFKSFEQLFNILGVINHIHYGTFNKICERIIMKEVMCANLWKT
ncbi:hypothetical protein RFI_03864 [Reticulomyxa filosa]|uniref:SecA DEAD-like N-terminal domain-containing protein n=1 Tax=Reticulomyxa filosa TaxID=46433 RepID=X6P547_RETFI|nr:hypothetical protein RFI_03864 [Reticulomyxa filosa]|eukprot:ETO33243.1 hypothetical protein RFI_03864 [Reticulomyxa filosa]